MHFLFISSISYLQANIIAQLIELWFVYPLLGLGFFILYMIANPLKVEQWHSIFSRLFSWASKKAEKSTVAGDIQYRVSSFVRNFNLGGILPYGLRIKWVDKDNIESFVEQNEVVVIMKKHDNNARNFIVATSAFFEQGFLPQVRSFIPLDIMSGAELVFQEKLIKKQRPDAISLFQKEIIDNKIKNPEINKYYLQFSDIDAGGLFEDIFLEEITFSGHRLEHIDPKVAKEDVDKFIQLLYDIASRKKGENTPLDYDGVTIHAWILLIARFETLVVGHEPYVRRVREATSKKYDTVFLVTRGFNIKFIQPLIKSIRNNTTAHYQWTKEIPTWNNDGEKRVVSISLFRLLT